MMIMMMIIMLVIIIIFWDRTIECAHYIIEARRPDILVMEKDSKKA